MPGSRLIARSFIASFCVFVFVASTRGQDEVDCRPYRWGDIPCDSGGSGSGWPSRPPGDPFPVWIADPPASRACWDGLPSATAHEECERLAPPLNNGFGGLTPENTDGTAFPDEGAIYYTSPIDPKADPTRNDVVVDPCSGQLTFRLPLSHVVHSRSGDIKLELIFSSGRNRPHGPLGNFWSGSWEKLIVADIAAPVGDDRCQEGPMPTTYRAWINALPRLVEHNGPSSTIWTNRDSIEFEEAFVDPYALRGNPDGYRELLGLPSGNLIDAGAIIPPDGRGRDYSVVFEVEASPGPVPPGTGPGPGEPIPATNLGPVWAGDYALAQARVGVSDYVPPLGDYRKLIPGCDSTQIRYPDGTIEYYQPFTILGEHELELTEGAGFNPIRDTSVCKLNAIIRPNGDVISYHYNERGELIHICDEMGRIAVSFTYNSDHRIVQIDDLLGRTTLITYDESGSHGVISSVTLDQLDQEWSFVTERHTTAAPSFETREVFLANGVTYLDELQVFEPQSGSPQALFVATMGNAASSGLYYQYPTVGALVFGGGAISADVDGDGNADHQFTTGKSIQYSYQFPTAVTETSVSTTTITDSLNHTRVHTFDWQSREISRTDSGPGLPVGGITTSFEYAGLYPEVKVAMNPLGDSTEEFRQHEVDDAPTSGYSWPASYYTRPEHVGERPRDRFQGGNVLTRTTHSADPLDTALVEQFTYEPVFTKVLTATTPLGTTTSYRYDYQESGVDNQDADFGLMVDSWTIGLDPSLINLGDLNGDGVVNHQQRGAVYRIEHPTVTQGLAVEIAGQSQVAREYATYNDIGQQLTAVDANGIVTAFEYYPLTDPDGDGLDPWAPPSFVIGAGLLARQIVDPTAAPHVGLDLETEYGYDKVGRRVWTRNPRGFHDFTVYDLANRVTIELSGNVSSSGSPNGPDFTHVEYDYAPNGNLLEKREFNDDPMTGPFGLRPNFATTRYGYDVLGYLRVVSVEVIHPTTHARSWAKTFWHYDGNGRVTKEVSPEGRAASYTHDALGRVLTKRRHLAFDPAPGTPTLPPPSPTGEEPEVQFAYDDNGNLLTATALGEVSNRTYTALYDGFSRRFKLTNPLGNYVEKLFDANSNVIEEGRFGPRDSLDTQVVQLSRSLHGFDERDRQHRSDNEHFKWDKLAGGAWQKVSIGDGWSVSESALDSMGRTTATRDDLGRVTSVYFDAAGREVRRERPLVSGFVARNATDRTLDANGNTTREVRHAVGKDNAGAEVVTQYTIDYVFDALDRCTGTTREPAGPSTIATSINYNNRGAATGTWDGKGLGVRHEFDTLLREVATQRGFLSDFSETTGQIVGPDNADGFVRVESSFDFDGNVNSQRDDKGNETYRLFDAANRFVELVYADQSYETVEYLREGPIERETRFDPSETEIYSVDYTYDDALRKTEVDFDIAASSDLFGVFEETFAYDGLGRVTASESFGKLKYGPESDSLATVNKRYDSLGKPIEDYQKVALYPVQPPVGPAWEGTVSSTYDGVGNRTKVELGSYVRNYAFDELNRTKSITNGAGATLHSMTYIGAGSRLNAQSNPVNGTATKAGLSGWDNHRRLITLQNLNASGGSAHSFSYAYDFNDNITEEQKTAPAGWIGKSQKYTYDAGDRLEEYVAGNPSSWPSTPTQEYGLDGVGNWIEHTVQGSQNSNTVNAVHEYQTSFDSVSVTYDERGNLKTYGGATYTYDVRGRIVGASANGQQYNYVFDADGRRILGEGWFTVCEGQRELRHVNTNSSTTDMRRMTYGDGIDDVLSFDRVIGSTTTTYVTHRNQMGAVCALSGSAGTILERYDYTPYGAVTAFDSDGNGQLIWSPVLYGGRRYDKSTGLYHMRARSYHPLMGRFTSRDPIGVWGDANNWGNPYSYGGNGPFGGCDPLGLSWNPLRAFAEWLVENKYDDEFKKAGGAFVGATDAATFGLVTLVVPVDEEMKDANFRAGFDAGAKAEQVVELGLGGAGAAKQGIKAGAKALLGLADEALSLTDDAAKLALKNGDEAAQAARATESGGDARRVGESIGSSAENTSKEVTVSRSRYPESAAHIDEAQAAGKPKELTVNRPGTDANRAAAQKGHEAVPGKQLDEYPPAFTKEGGAGASVKPVSPSDNMGAGASIGNQSRSVPDGGKIEIKVVD